MTSIPSHASVVVIGGGVMGCSTLYHLGKLGVSDAILLERNKLTSGTTWHSAAQVRALRSSKNLTRMIQYSVELYSQLEQETGQNVGWIQKGSLSIATTPDRLVHIKRQEALAHAYGLDATTISKSEALERWPLMHGDDVLGAVWSPDDGRVSPSDVCAALTKGAKSSGNQIFENCGVTAVLTKNGRITGVETTQGTVMCDAIAVCSGLWSREIGAMAGAEIPVLACEHFYLLTKPIDGIRGNTPTLSDHDSHLYIRDDSGGLLIGCFEPMGKAIAPGILTETFEFGLLPEDWDHFEPMMELAMHRLPALENTEIKMLLNGPESFTPDGVFMLGETAETKGLFLGCGLNSVGIASGGGAGMNLAHAIVNGHTAYDLSEADAKRFAPSFNNIDHLMHRAPEILGTHYEISYPGRQLKTSRNLNKLVLHEEYIGRKAHMGQFFDWERPLYFNKEYEPVLTFGKPDWFDNVAREVTYAHSSAAIFDMSCFGKIDVIGVDAECFLLKICAGYMQRPAGSVIYSAVLNNRGTYETDITAQRITDNHYRLFVGTTAIKRDLAWFRRMTSGFNIRIEDVTLKYGMLSLMGPNAGDIIAKCGASELNSLGYFKTCEAKLAGKPIRAARISYVGEAGWEITCGAEDIPEIFASIKSFGGQPAGLFAQTSMRIEKGFCAVGHELDSDVGPIDVGLDCFTRKTGGFTGYEAMEQKRRDGAVNKLISLTLNDLNAVPIGGEPIYLGDQIIGQTTSCAFGFRVGKPIALGHVKEMIPDNTSVNVDIARQLYSAKVSTGPLFDGDGLRMKA